MADNKWLLLSAGGVAGTVSRYWVAAMLSQIAGTGFPYGTLVVNLSACLMIGVFSGLEVVRGMISPGARLLLMTGFCGAYSTFSTWILESASLFGGGEAFRALVNLFGSVGLGFLLFRLGVYLGMAI